MKFKLLLASLALVFSAVTFGQDATKMRSEEDLKAEAMKLTENMTKYLELDENQTARMKGLNMTFVQKKAEFAAMDAPGEEKMKMFEDFKTKHVGTIKQVLTEEQFEKFLGKYQETMELKKQKRMDKKM